MDVDSDLRIYTGMAVASLAALFLWQSFAVHVKAMTPQDTTIHFYQHVLGEFDGRPCPSYPVCSVYARQAIQRHGLLLGSWFALDRLIHENNDLQYGSWWIFEGEKRLYDPLSRNDLWIRREQQ